jgi:hypothetical protein
VAKAKNGEEQNEKEKVSSANKESLLVQKVYAFQDNGVSRPTFSTSYLFGAEGG